MVLTEKVRAKLGGGCQMAVWEVTALAAGANNISAPALGLEYITIAEFIPTVGVTSAAATSWFPILGTNSGTHVTITTVPTDGANNAGSLQVYGY